MKHIIALIITVRDTLKKPLIYIIVFQLIGGGIIGGVVFWLFNKVLTDRDVTISTLRTENAELKTDNKQLRALLTDFLVGANGRTQTLYDSAVAELKRVKQ